MRSVFGMLVLALLVPALAAAEDQVVLGAQPSVKVESAHEGTDHKTLSESEAQEAQVVIVKRGGSYFWSSRENRELHYRQSGI